VLPLKDNQPTSTFPIVTILLIVANVVVYLAQQIFPLEQIYTLVPAAVTHNAPAIVQILPGGHMRIITNAPEAVRPVWLTLFTSMFLHASISHIGFNMLYLWIFGNNIEDALGKVRFLFFYFACGLVAALSQILPDPNSTVPVLGASGAIAGVLGAYYILYPQARVLTIVPVIFAFFFELRAWFVLGAWFVLQFVQAIMSFGVQQGGVAIFAHVGGFIAGVILIKLMGGRKLAQGQYRRTSYYPPSQRPYRYF
jgi:membrane associated rhomboid family serine protease